MPMHLPFYSFMLPYAAVMKDSLVRSPFLLERRRLVNLNHKSSKSHEDSRVPIHSIAYGR